MNFRGFINRWLAELGVELRIKPSRLVRSHHELPMTIEFVIAHFMAGSSEPVRLVQIGAFDGRSNDPLTELHRRYGWHAALVEPQERPFRALAQLHAANERVQVFNVALAEEDGSKPLYFLEEADDLPDWAPQIASFSREHVLRSQSYMPAGIDVAARVRTTRVPTVTVSTLLDEAGFPAVDILLVDAEGYDLDVLQMFDIPRRRPAVVGYEHQHLTRSERDAAANLLITAGYRLAMDYGGGDTVAYLS